MIPVFQTDFGSETGNCWPATIASILEIPQDRLHEIPNFCALYGSQWAEETNKWLRKFGLWFVTCPAGKAFDCEKGELIENAEFIPSGFHGLSGIGPRGIWHSCVGYDGEIIHDPFPGSLGLIDIRMYDIFVPLDLIQGVIIKSGSRKTRAKCHEQSDQNYENVVGGRGFEPPTPAV